MQRVISENMSSLSYEWAHRISINDIKGLSVG